MSVVVRPYKRGGFEVDIALVLPNGQPFRQRVKSPASSKSGARRWGEERERHVLLNWQAVIETKETKEVPTLSEFWERYINEYVIANRQKPSVIEHKRMIIKAHLLPRFGSKRLDEIDTACVQQLKAALADRNAKTVNNVLSNLNVLLKAAVELKVIEHVPVTAKLLKTAVSESDYYEFAPYEHMVKAAAKIDWRVLGLVLLGGDAGLRRGEIIAFEQTDADHRRGFLSVNRSDWKGNVTLPKGGRGRRVPMTARLSKLIAEARHLRGDRWLTRDDGSPLTAKAVREWIEKAQRLAGLPVTGKIHVLRHTFCSHLAMRGAALIDIKELAGHVSVSTTQRYMHLSPQNADRAIRLLDEGRARDGFGDILETRKARA